MEKKAAVSFALYCRFASVYSSELFREYRFANSRFLEFSEILGGTGLPNQDTFVSALEYCHLDLPSDKFMKKISND